MSDRRAEDSRVGRLPADDVDIVVGLVAFDLGQGDRSGLRVGDHDRSPDDREPDVGLRDKMESPRRR
jgi:hypothetical protein